MELKYCILNSHRDVLMLLIVPYGIEIIVSLQDVTDLIELLIVPYGIEIALLEELLLRNCTFNRTLWN